MSPKELRENAEECMDWARTARSDRERAIFLQMAETWRQAADRLERVQRRSYTLEHSTPRGDRISVCPSDGSFSAD